MPAMRVEEHFTMTALYSADLFILEIGLRGKKFIRINLREICHLRYKLEANGKPLEIAYAQWRIQDFCKGGAAAGAFGVPQAPSCPLSLRPLRKFSGS